MNEADPRVKRTRKLLQDAFMELLAEKSFHAISVRDIAERAALNRATFYAHFEDKYALMDYLVADLFHQALRRRLTDGAPFTRANLHLLVVTVCAFLGQFHGHCAPPGRDLDPRIEAKVQQELDTFLLDWLAPAPLPGPPAMDSSLVTRETAASVMSWAIFGAGIQWSRGDRARSADDWARQVVAVIVGGVARIVSLPSDPLPAHTDRREPADSRLASALPASPPRG
jgi:AcrR family transcriptional regulator